MFDYIECDSTIFEREPLKNLAKENQLSAYKHKGFWKPMDTLRDKNELEKCGKVVKLHGRYGNSRN